MGTPSGPVAGAVVGAVGAEEVGGALLGAEEGGGAPPPPPPPPGAAGYPEFMCG